MDAASSSKRRSQGGDSKYGFAAAANGSIQRDALVSHSPRSHYNSAASGTPSRPGYAYSPSSRGQPPNGPNGNSTYGHNGVSPHPQQHRSPDSARSEEKSCLQPERFTLQVDERGQFWHVPAPLLAADLLAVSVSGPRTRSAGIAAQSGPHQQTEGDAAVGPGATVRLAGG